MHLMLFSRLRVSYRQRRDDKQRTLHLLLLVHTKTRMHRRTCACTHMHTRTHLHTLVFNKVKLQHLHLFVLVSNCTGHISHLYKQSKVGNGQSNNLSKSQITFS